MSKAFVLAETEQGARELCAGARSFADEVVLCCAGVPAVDSIADVCVHIEVPEENVIDDAYLSVIDAYRRAGCTVALAEQTSRMLSLVGRLAASHNAAAITGVTAFQGAEGSSAYFGGAGVRVAKPAGDSAFYTVSAGVFDGAAATGTTAVEEVPFQKPASAIVKTGSSEVASAGVNLAGAERVISCGRGFAEKDDLQLAYDLATKIGAEVGCTRPLAEGVDWFPRAAYIGVSGAMLSPKVAVLLGVSGQMQHMIGLNTADTVVAVNKDKNAPVFNMCDYGFVGDVETVLPEIMAAL